MMPDGAHRKIRSVKINYSSYIRGFNFFDKDGTLLWKIGSILPWFKVETVELAENEVIIGVVAKIRFPAWYTDFQLQIAAIP